MTPEINTNSSYPLKYSFFYPPPPIIVIQNFEPQNNGSSLRMYENFRVSPPLAYTPYHSVYLSLFMRLA